MKRKFLSSIVVISALLLVSFGAEADEPLNLTPAQPGECPFKAGERLEYEFGWNGIPAARAVMTVTQIVVNNVMAYKLRTETFTTGRVRLLWKMDDWGESIVHPRTLKPIMFFMHQDEAGMVADTFVAFDHDSKVAKITRTSKRKTKKKELRLTDAYDPLSLVYLLRCIKLNVGEKKVFEIVDGHHTYKVIFDIIAKEKITVKAGSYTSYKIRPAFVQTPPPVKKEEKILYSADLWINADPPNYLLQVKSKIMVGTVYGELVSVSH